MFRLTAPSDDMVRRFIAAQHDLPFTYPAVGATRATPPPGYNVDRNRIRLGSGPATYQRAIAALQRWEMFNIGWVQLCWPAMPEVGATFAVLIRHLGFWSLNSTRLVYVHQEDGPVQRYSFAYGTLPGHAESGEERFSIEWHHGDDSIWYEIFAFSRPRHPLTWAGYPLTRILQKRFTRDSKAAMARVVDVP
jgi:uncharacterized protein (UPF0548 family)